MHDPGEDIFTAALDVVTPESFDRARGDVDRPHLRDKRRSTTEWVAEVYGP